MRGPRVLLVLPLLLTACSSAPSGPTLSAAASLAPFLAEAGPAFEAETGIRIAVRAGASGALAGQILAGAPTDLFLSADPRWTEALWSKGRVTGSPVTVARNRLVVVVPAGAAAAPADLAGLAALERIGLADPTVAPAGEYAREALVAAGVWDRVAERRIEAADVRAALSLVERGEVDAAIVYASDAANDPRVRTAFAVDPALHRPVEITAALLAGAEHPEAADRFLLFLSSEPGRALLARHGFLPGAS